MSGNDSSCLKNCTFIKTILMITVILYHSCLFWRGNWLDSPPIIDALINFAAAFIGSLIISNILMKNEITRKMIGLK